MKILLIITPFAPAQTPNTLRWLPILKELKKRGYELHVLTSKWSADTQMADSDYTLYRTGHNTLLDKVYDMLKLKNRRGETGNPVKLKREGLFRQFIEKLTDIFWRKNYWPDGSVLFLKPGMRKAKKIVRENDIGHVISVGLPFTCHLIAKAVKIEKPLIHWHMDIQDVFSISSEFWVNNFNKYQKKNLLEETKAIELADSISHTNRNALKRYQGLFPFAKNKMKVIPPLFVLPEKIIYEAKILDQSKIHVGYFGSFYKTVRSPEKFLQFLEFLLVSHSEKMNRIQFHFYGEQSRYSLSLFEKYKSALTILNIEGLLSRAENHATIEQMDVLLNFGNTTDYHLPSKVVDFLYFQKPLVNVIENENDSSQSFLEGKVDLLNLNFNKGKHSELAVELLDFVFRKRPPSQCDEEAISSYLPGHIAGMYLKSIG